MERFITHHAVGDRWGEAFPPWEAWFDPLAGAPLGGNAYYKTERCEHCQGIGIEPGETTPCLVCTGQDNDGNGLTDVRASISDLRTSEWRTATQLLRDTAYRAEWGVAVTDALYDFLDARIYTNAYGEAEPRPPLVLAPEFFKFGLNVGAWRGPGSPMLFSDTREPDWGYVAITSTRLRIPDPDTPEGYRDRFDDPDAREIWCDTSYHNLYNAGIVPHLVPSRYQIEEFDLEDDLLLGVSVRETDESGLSYLWDAILGAGHVGHVQHNGWLDQYDGRADYDVGRRLRNMMNRQGDPFNLRTEELDEVVAH